MTNYPGLKAEIAKPVYDGMTDEQIAAALVEETVEERRDVSVTFVESYLRQRLLLSQIAAFAAAPPNGTPPQAIGAALELVGLISSPRLSSFQTSVPAILTGLAQLLGALGPSGVGILSAQNVSDLLGESLVITCRARQLGFNPAVHDMAQEIAAARLVEG